MLDWNQWNGKKVAFLGDSITDKCHVGTAKNYWQYLQEYLGIRPYVYGVNGARWDHAPTQIQNMKDELGTDVDAIFIFMGTNDYNGGIPIGEWFSYADSTENYNGQQITIRKRSFVFDNETYCGRINIALNQLKNDYPQAQIILMTPIHRAFATFGDINVQPNELCGNCIGLYLETYVQKIVEAGQIWAIPVIDLYSLCGLFPLADSNTQYFHEEKTDRLHPNAAGHERMAKTIAYQVMALPASFR